MTSRIVLISFLLAAAPAFAQMPQPPSPWKPPSGIPAPPFGINERAGTPTHYVDNTHPSATDTSNPNGTPTRPRRTVPTSLPAGSVVEVRGGPYPTGKIAWYAEGTASAPVFIKGVGNPIFRGELGSRIAAAGRYLIIEGIVMEGMPLHMAPDLSHFSFRFNTLRYHMPTANSSAISPAGTNIVLFGNEVHHNGDPNGSVEQDVHGIKPDTGVSRLWIVDNHIHHHGGDAIQVGNAASAEPWAQYIYIGRNVLHEDRENGVDIKKARDVVISENLIYGYLARSSSAGEAIVTHYEPERIWVVNNRVSLSNQGIVSTGAIGYFVIGNVIDRIVHHPQDPNYDPNSLFRTAGILTYNTRESYHVNNTIWDSDAGISYASGSFKTEIVNNIIGNLQQPTFHIGFGSSTTLDMAVVTHNLLAGSARIKVGGRIDSCAGYTECLNADPLFYDPSNGDYDLQAGSPAIDSGRTHPVYAYFQSLYGVSIAADYKGAPRPSGPAMDRGGLEFTGGRPAPPTNLRIIR